MWKCEKIFAKYIIRWGFALSWVFHFKLQHFEIRLSSCTINSPKSFENAYDFHIEVFFGGALTRVCCEIFKLQNKSSWNSCWLRYWSCPKYDCRVSPIFDGWRLYRNYYLEFKKKVNQSLVLDTNNESLETPQFFFLPLHMANFKFHSNPQLVSLSSSLLSSHNKSLHYEKKRASGLEATQSTSKAHTRHNWDC